MVFPSRIQYAALLYDLPGRHIREYIDLRYGKILDYSYTVFGGAERIRWYDPQPHPELIELAVTFPHHYHAPPDIKHNRQPAFGISFDAPNLATLIDACLQLADYD